MTINISDTVWQSNFTMLCISSAAQFSSSTLYQFSSIEKELDSKFVAGWSIIRSKVWAKVGNIESGIELQVGWKINDICIVIDTLLDVIRADTSKLKFVVSTSWETTFPKVYHD